MRKLIKLQKGNRITIPQKFVKAFNLKIGDKIEVKIVDRCIVLTPFKQPSK